MAEPTRDRDAAGRALNARPRDALGRPLPYGSKGVPRAPEGVRRPPEETLRAADELLRSGRPFHAHEVLEDAWKSAVDPERELWRGLAQLAVGLTHLARGHPDRAARLLDRGAGSVSRYRDLTANDDNPGSSPQLPPLDLNAVLSWAVKASQACRDTPSASALEVPAPPLRSSRAPDLGG